MVRRGHAQWGWLFAAWAAVATTARTADGDPADDTARRKQLDVDRAAAQARYERTVRECESHFVVTACVDQAKAERRMALDRVAREQAALDDAQRKRRAEERRQHIAQKQAQQASAARGAAAPTPPLQVGTPRPSLAGSTARPARRAEVRSSEAAAAAAAEAAHRAAQAQERREHAQAHEEAVRERNAERAAQRAPAAPLPAPGASALK
jgi:colicin import membrane protein